MGHTFTKTAVVFFKFKFSLVHCIFICKIWQIYFSGTCAWHCKPAFAGLGQILPHPISVY